MGYHIHHAIVCTSWKDEHIEEAHKRASSIFKRHCVSSIIKGVVNGYRSFFIAPDGSKEHWNESDVFDDLRKQFKEWLVRENLFIDWAEIGFGGDEPKKNEYIEQGFYKEPVE